MTAAGGRLTVVCPDLPGYGRSGKPTPAPGHEPHSKRAGAGHVLAMMRALGHERFALAGHDRGSYLALRLMLDHPAAVRRVALLDCCRSATTSPAPTRGSRPGGGTGSSSPSRTSPSG